MTFKDHFTGAAAAYAAARPTYPDALFRFVADRAPARRVAWDCATGNGQAARDLVRYFARVVATDASEQQLAQAPARNGVEYRVASAERSGLEAGSVDAITVATALHWFDFDAFYREAERVLVPAGLLVAWSYGNVSVGAELDPIVREFQRDVVGPYWPPERRYVDEGYATIPFPLREIEPPRLEMRVPYTLDQLLAYLGSWSSTMRYARATGTDPIPALRAQLEPRWGRSGARREARWPLNIRAGYVS
ncbi:MAG: class I SAM-dependent methyltransferase [Gemmatimonadaceae bacterium]